MLWCPKCKTEYDRKCQNGSAKCAECGETLVEKIKDPPDEAFEDIGAATEEADIEDEVFLANLSGHVEISYITSMLEEESISYRVMEGDIGQYLSVLQGTSFFGKDVYVSAKDFERAADIVKSFKAETLDEDGENI